MTQHTLLRLRTSQVALRQIQLGHGRIQFADIVGQGEARTSFEQTNNPPGEVLTIYTAPGGDHANDRQR